MLRRMLLVFVPQAVLATCLAGLIYVVVQQDLRTGANDPQQQLAEDAAAQLNAGTVPSALVSGTKVDLAASLAPFLVIYDTTGSVLATDGQLDGGPPKIPIGVLETARANGLDVVTWQPRPGLRFATVSLPWAGGSVMAGRSLRLVEQRESQLELLVAAGWLATLIALAVTGIVIGRLWPGRSAIRCYGALGNITQPLEAGPTSPATARITPVAGS